MQHPSRSPAAGRLLRHIKLGTSLLEIQQISANPPCSQLPNPPPPPSQGAELFKASCEQPLILATRNHPSRCSWYGGSGSRGEAAVPTSCAAGANGREEYASPLNRCPDSGLMRCCRNRRLWPLCPRRWMLFLSCFPRPRWKEDQKRSKQGHERKQSRCRQWWPGTRKQARDGDGVCEQAWDGVTSLVPWEPRCIAHILASCIAVPAVQDLPQGPRSSLFHVWLSSHWHTSLRHCQRCSRIILRSSHELSCQHRGPCSLLYTMLWAKVVNKPVGCAGSGQG